MGGVTSDLLCADVYGGRGTYASFPKILNMRKVITWVAASAHIFSRDSVEVVHYLCVQ